MARRAVRHGCVIACDMPKCGAVYATYSMVSVARKQALAAGWARVRGRSVYDSEGYRLAIGGAKVDLCPTHKPELRMSRAAGGQRG